MRGVYYNEIDPYAAAWLRALIAKGQIPDGEVDTRSIVEVDPGDVAGFIHCHWFAGIGGWPYALRLAGWPDDRAVWTGSCPCQPFSAAGARAGGADARDLWPAWARLIRECRPGVVFGEQVEAAIAHGWYDRVCDDLEREGYAVGACSLPAASVGAFHLRQRLWFVADAAGVSSAEHERGTRERAVRGAPDAAIGRGTARGVADPGRDGDREHARELPGDESQHAERAAHGDHASLAGGATRDVADPESGGQRIDGRAPGHAGRVDERGAAEWMGDAGGAGWKGHEHAAVCGAGGRPQGGATPESGRAPGGVADADEPQPGDGGLQRRGRFLQPAENPAAGVWDAVEWIPCADGKLRPVEPGTFPLAHGVSGRVGRLRGYGNAIVPQVAAAVLTAYLSLDRGGGG